MSNKVSYIIQLKDQFSVTAKKIQGSLSGIQNKSRQVGASMKAMGNSMKMVSLAAAAFIGNSVRLFDQQAMAVAKVKTGLESTAHAAGLSFAELEKAATDLQRNTIFGDEEILAGATSTLLTFTKITGKEFLKTQELTVDLAAKMGTDLQSAAIQVGKALNDPVANLGALGRAGIQFDDTQRELIKGFAKSGQIQKAQAIILKELETQFGGTGEAMAQVGAGPLKQISNSLGDLSEEIGKISMGMLKPFIGMVRKATAAFKNASPAVKKLVAGLAIFLAVGAPLLILLGSIAIAVNAISFPVIAVIAVIAALGAAIFLVATNWDNIVEAMGNAFEDFTIWVTNALIKMVNFAIKTLNMIIAPVSALSDALGFGEIKITQLKEVALRQEAPSAPDRQTNGTIDGKIVVSAAPGAVVQSTSMSAKGSGLNIGTNMVGA